MNFDFSLKKYEELCSAIIEDYSTLTFEEYLSSAPEDKFAILRHDVDRLPSNALKMCKIEHDLNIRSTYYFRVNRSVFKPDIIKRIASMGHEIGYHYECLDKSNGNIKEAIKIFEKDLKKLREIYNVRTICQHGNPFTKYNNRDLWNHCDFKKYGIYGESYLSLGKDIVYFSDTGRNWGNKYKVKDISVNFRKTPTGINIKSTDDLIHLIKINKFKNLCILTHPERWSKTIIEWIAYFTLDKAIQLLKIMKYKQ